MWQFAFDIKQYIYIHSKYHFIHACIQLKDDKVCSCIGCVGNQEMGGPGRGGEGKLFYSSEGPEMGKNVIRRGRESIWCLRQLSLQGSKVEEETKKITTSLPSKPSSSIRQG